MPCKNAGLQHLKYIGGIVENSKPHCTVPGRVTGRPAQFGWAGLPARTPLPAEEVEEAERLPSSRPLRGAEPFLLPTYCSHVLETPDSIFPTTHKTLAEEQTVWLKEENFTVETTI